MMQTDSVQLFRNIKMMNSNPKGGSQGYKSVQTALEIVLRCQHDDAKRQNVKIVVAKYFRQDNPSVCMELESQSLHMFNQIRDWNKYFKFGHIQLVNQIREYSKYESSDIMDYLISIQHKLVYQDIVESYRKQLMEERHLFNWTEQFVNDWVQQAKYMKENKIQLFKKRTAQSKNLPTLKASLKRSAPSTKNEVQTQAGQEPVKKVKKDSINFKVIVSSVQRIIDISEEQEEKNMIKNRLEQFMKTQNIQFIQLLDQKTAKRIYEMRSYVKLFMDAFVELTEKAEYKQYANKKMFQIIIKCQEYIDPDNVFQSYRDLIANNLLNLEWSKEMAHALLKRVIELKTIELETMLGR